MRDEKGMAWVIGASSGIGSAVARRLDADGWPLVLTDEPGARREQNLPGIRWWGTCDVRNPGLVEETYRQIRLEVGEIAVVSYNAGVSGPYDDAAATAEAWYRTLDVNLLGAVWVARAVSDDMSARRSGAIILTASTNAHKPGSYMIPYRVSKAALAMYTRCLALQLAPHGVRVNAICPGIVLTPMQLRLNEERAVAQGSNPADALAARRERIPTGRFVTPEEVAEAVALLASDRIPSLIGQEIVIDGGDVQYL